MSVEDDHRIPGSLSRRDFVAGTVVGATTIWLTPFVSSALLASEADPNVGVLTARERKVVESITGRILPSDDTPGAIEARCVDFIDRALAHDDAPLLALYRSGIAELDRTSRILFGEGFAELPARDQDRHLGDLEVGRVPRWRASSASQEELFRTVRLHTLLGFVLDPKYGGNRDYAGWRTMGFPGVVHHLGGSRPDQMINERPFVPIWVQKGDLK